MSLHKGLTDIHSQKDPRLHFGESFALRRWIEETREKLHMWFSLTQARGDQQTPS